MSFVETPLWLRVRWHGETAPGQLNVISREVYVGGLGEWCENHPPKCIPFPWNEQFWNISYLVWIGSAEHWLKQKQEWISPKTIAEGSGKKLAQRRSLFSFWIEYRNSERVWFVYICLHPCRKWSNGPKKLSWRQLQYFQCIGSWKQLLCQLCTPPHRRTAMLASQYLHGDFDGFCMFTLSVTSALWCQ